jgi:hypothetical protein
MTDRFKGVLVNFDREIREDDAESIIIALKMIRGVLSVKPYKVNSEDYMMYERGHREATEKMMKLLVKDPGMPK